MWYAMQVSTGREDSILRKIEQAVDPALLEECFVPRYRTARLHNGAWEPCTQVLFPGYLIVVTRYADALKSALRKVPDYTRLLSIGDTFVPLNREEINWIDAVTQREHRVIEMSTGYMEGDHVVVTSGPLVGREGWIRKVNHRKKVAYLEIQMFGRTLNVEVGLRIVRKRT